MNSQTINEITLTKNDFTQNSVELSLELYMKAILCFLLCSALPLFARVGETKKQCKERYGADLAFGGLKDSFLFEKNKMTIRCFFTEDVCDWIVYVSREYDPATADLPAAYAKARDLTENEIQTLLAFNGGGWMKIRVPGFDIAWGTPDGLLIACYTFKTRNLQIATKARFDSERLKEANKLNGL